MPQQGQYSHVMTTLTFFPLKWTKLFLEFPIEGKFGSWLFPTRTGETVPEVLVQVKQEQQQAVNLARGRRPGPSLDQGTGG